MKHKFRNELQESGNLVGRDLGWMVVAGVDCRNLAVLCCVGSVEVVAADGEALEYDYEYLYFDAVLHVLLILGENLIERLLEQPAVESVVY